MTQFKLPLETDRLVLRPFKLSDLDAVESYMVRQDAQRYLDGKVRDRGDCRAVLEAMSRQVTLQRPGDTLSLAVTDKASGKLIGQISLRWSDATAAQAEIRFILDPAYRGKGLATEAISKIVDVAFDEFRLHRIFARCDARNTRSARLMQKLGMRLEAHYREHALFQGEWDEELHFAILDREWRRSSKVRELTHRVA